MKNLSPFEKEQEIHLKLLKYMRENRNGKHISDIQKETGISRKTLEKHLNLLEFENEIYCKQYGPTRVYYPSNMFHHIDNEILKTKNRTIWGNILENEYGKFLLIKEKRRIENKWVTKGSLLIPVEKKDEFRKNLEKFLNSNKIRKFSDKAK